MIRKLIPLVVLSLLSSLHSNAAVIYDSSLNGTTVSTFGVLSGNNTGKAVGFTLGTAGALGVSGYSLDSITVRLKNQRATTVLTSEYTFSLWSSDAVQSPLAQLATFTSVALTASTTADYTLNISSSFTLQPSTSYWIVAQSTLTDSGSGTTLPAWMGLGGTATTASGVSVTSPVGIFGSTGSPGVWPGTSGLANDLQINATAIPEPSTWVLALGGFVSLVVLRRFISRAS